jgi:hypothetical protein
MSQRIVLTGSRFVQDVRDQFYFSSPEKFGGGAALGDQVAIVSDVTGNLLAIGEIISEGKPYDECRTVNVTKRFL